MSLLLSRGKVALTRLKKCLSDVEKSVFEQLMLCMGNGWFATKLARGSCRVPGVEGVHQCEIKNSRGLLSELHVNNSEP